MIDVLSVLNATDHSRPSHRLTTYGPIEKIRRYVKIKRCVLHVKLRTLIISISCQWDISKCVSVFSQCDPNFSVTCMKNIYTQGQLNQFFGQSETLIDQLTLNLSKSLKGLHHSIRYCVSFSSELLYLQVLSKKK